MSKRDLFAELSTALNEAKAHRKGKLTLKTHEVETASELNISPTEILSIREQLNMSRGVFARYLQCSWRYVIALCTIAAGSVSTIPSRLDLNQCTVAQLSKLNLSINSRKSQKENPRSDQQSLGFRLRTLQAADWDLTLAPDAKTLAFPRSGYGHSTSLLN